MSLINILLPLVLLKLHLKSFLDILSLSFKVKDSLVTCCVHHVCLDCVYFLCQKGDSLPFFRNFLFVLLSLYILVLHDARLVFTHLIKLDLALNELGLELSHQTFASAIQARDLNSEVLVELWIILTWIHNRALHDELPPGVLAARLWARRYISIEPTIVSIIRWFSCRLQSRTIIASS